MTFTRLVLVLITWAVAHASQAATTGVRGHVTDPDGLALPGVVVTLSTIGSDPQTVASAVTDQSGEYTFDVPDGEYSLAAELSGFEIAKRGVIGRSDVATLDMRLAVASFQD